MSASTTPPPSGSPVTYVERLPPADGKGKDGVHKQKGLQQSFDYSGRYGSLTGAIHVQVIKPEQWGPVATLEISVEEGKLRGYMNDKNRPYYIEATPGHPATTTGNMMLMRVYRFMLEAADGEAKGASYRIWR